MSPKLEIVEKNFGLIGFCLIKMGWYSLIDDACQAWIIQAVINFGLGFKCTLAIGSNPII